MSRLKSIVVLLKLSDIFNEDIQDSNFSSSIVIIIKQNKNKN